ncbi:hypothetical protein NDU88_006468 [Pleurodeles waltl]|uniref:Uncharacterized protein n=1 Tax=Pleurodeles waltl TaxID=8319 RepID=A0AAV7MZA2_PLEWA|nr:hypothetical protein NDU88_006468 [Pleurodeles waltl]
MKSCVVGAWLSADGVGRELGVLLTELHQLRASYTLAAQIDQVDQRATASLPSSDLAQSLLESCMALITCFEERNLTTEYEDARHGLSTMAMICPTGYPDWLGQPRRPPSAAKDTYVVSASTGKGSCRDPDRGRHGQDLGASGESGGLLRMAPLGPIRFVADTAGHYIR